MGSFKTVPAATAYHVGMLVERAAKLRAQSEAIAAQAQKALMDARAIVRDVGLDPDADQLITDDEARFGTEALPVGAIIRNGQPVREEEPAPPAQAQSVDA